MRVAIIGYGKMGHMIEACALKRGHEIVARIDAGDTLDLQDADVAIEFSTPTTAEANVRTALQQGVPVVSGTTGWDISGCEQLAKELGVPFRWSSNFSIGVNIFFAINELLAERMATQPQYTPSISETHHIHKLDAPSGTAVAIANQIAKVHTYPLNEQATDGSALPKNRAFSLQSTISSGTPIIMNGIPIESIREGEVPGTHVVTWDSPEDTIIITHIAKGREGFALGAVITAEKIGLRTK